MEGQISTSVKSDCPAVCISLDQLEDCCRDIVDRVYNQILCRIECNLITYKGYENNNNTNNAWIKYEIKRQEMLKRYVIFIRKNGGYWSTVRDELLRRTTHGNISL